jgi:dTDP-4-dehydrorhamnose reductase
MFQNVIGVRGLMQNHLVVGINGTIGSALFAHLQSIAAANNIRVWGTTQRSENIQQQNVFHLNLLDSPSMWHFPIAAFDVVYLCAGVCRMALCEEDPITTRKVNIAGMEALVRRCAAAGAFIVYLSTNQVFSGNTRHVPANAVHQPLNEYGAQKAQMEQLVQTICQRWAIVRLTKVVEPNMALIKNWLTRLRQHQPIEVFHDMMLAPVTLRQVVTTLITIGQKKAAGHYQISGAQDTSYSEIAAYLAQQIKRPSSLVQTISALDRGIKKSFLPLFTTLDCSSTMALCGEKPPHFSDVLHECFNMEE